MSANLPKEKMEFDIIIVGAGPAGLSAAIRLAQLSQQQSSFLSICVLDKGAEIGAHSVSGAILEPRALNELIPTWQQRNAPVTTQVTQEKLLYLTKKWAMRLPSPPQMHNEGNYIISLSQFCRWLAEQAEALGVNIFPGFAATELLYKDEKVCGVVTGDKGVDRFGQATERYQSGMELYANQILLAEGCRGSLTKQVIAKFHLDKYSDPQTYGLGFKEVWEIPAELHQPGSVIHSIGWPLENNTYGGGFAYHYEKKFLTIGFVVALDYQNPYLNPYEEFQRFKTHPSIVNLLKNSKRIAYGARSVSEGGLQSLPKLTFPGGLLIGDSAGFLNVPKIKGIHNAMKSGMIAAESLFSNHQALHECTDYSVNIKKSWVWDELYQARNIRPAFRWGLTLGLTYAAIDTYLFKGKAPWTFNQHADHAQLKPAKQCKKIEYPKHDNHITFDLTQSLYLANIQYHENQPYHLKLANRPVAIEINYKIYASPESRYCPAGVYEILTDANNNPRLQINGGNCIHCKACDIKDPTQNITWTPSEGGSGPNYTVL